MEHTFSCEKYSFYHNLSVLSYPYSIRSILPILSILPIINYPAHPSHREYPDKNPPYTMHEELKKKS